MARNLKWTEYAKWTATAILIIGTGINSLGFYPLGPIVLAVGGFIWLAVSLAWREPSLIITNAVMSITGVMGILYKML
jgi:hypothetical protein